MNESDFGENNIRKMLEKKELTLAANTKDTAPVWNDLRLIFHPSNPTRPITGWVACLYCSRPFRSHSNPDANGKRRNYGLTSVAKHISRCNIRKKAIAAKRKQTLDIEKENGNEPQNSSNSKIDTSNKITKFLFNKNLLPKAWQNRIKDAECKYVVAGMYVLEMVEQFNLFCFCQACTLFNQLNMMVFYI